MSPFHCSFNSRRLPAATVLATLVALYAASTPVARAADAGLDGSVATDAGAPAASTDGGAEAVPEHLFLTPGEGRKRPGVVVFSQDFEVDATPDSVQPTMNFPFFARVDRVILTGELTILFQMPPRHGHDIRSIDVIVNQEKIATLEWSDLMRHPGERQITIPAQDLSDRNLLTLKMQVDDPGPCGEVPEGVWRSLKRVKLVTEAAPLPLPNNLGLLPVPFVDRDFDKESTVPFTLPVQPTDAMLENAGIVASWLGTAVAIPLDFPVRLGELPEASAVVLVDSAEQATALGLPAPDGAMVQMLDHPKFPANYKILLIAGRTPEELAIAVHSLAAPGTTLAGEVVHFTSRPVEHASIPYDAPRWLPFQQKVPFDKYPPYVGNAANLSLEGGRDGVIPLRFRIAPDLWSWPAEFVDLDLGYSVQLAPGVQMPRLDLFFNDLYMATLPQPAKGERDGRVSLRVRASQIRGYDEFDLRVHYPRQEGECDNGPTNESRVSIAPDSTLSLEGFGHYAEMPDVATFVHDGYPFSRIADLGQTVVVMPDNSPASDISTYLSMLAHIGNITGTVGTRVQVLSSERFMQGHPPNKDLLVIGRYDDNQQLRSWIGRMPLTENKDGWKVEMPDEPGHPLLRKWHELLSYRELDHAKDVLFKERQFSAVVGIPSPVQEGRNAVIVTGTSGALMPSAKDFAGEMETSNRSGDLIIAAGLQRWMFRIAPVHGQGIVSHWVAIRRFFNLQFPLLFPGMVLGSVLIAFQLKSGVSRRIKKRLGQDDT